MSDTSAEVSSQTHAVLGRAIPGGRVPMLGMKAQNLVVFSNHSAFHWWSTQSAALLLSLDELMSCAASTKNGVSIWDVVHSQSMDRWTLVEFRAKGQGFVAVIDF